LNQVPQAMHLDIPTLMVMGSFVAACSGSILLGAWLANQKAPVLGQWGIASVLHAAGIFSLMLGVTSHDPRFAALGNVVIALAQGFMWRGARAFDNKPAAPAIAFLGALLLALASLHPVAQDNSAHVGLLINTVYLFAAAHAFWSAQQPSLPARWPIVAIITLHAAVMLIGAVTLFNGAPDLVPPLMSLFGVIHFESIVFSVGTAALVLALVKERNEAASKLIASIDSMTGIANRAAFMAGAERVLARCRHDGLPVSVIMFDLDIFKSINDNHGHAIGDAVIQKFSEVASTTIRNNDVFGRIGGEEFAVLLSRSSIEAATVRADRIRLAFAESCRSIREHQVNATVSGGVSASGNAETTLSALLEQADEALYRAKAAGRNRIRRAGSKPQVVETPAPVIRVA
jgi:diguanylate cyclase (GGDEF)-like protein